MLCRPRSALAALVFVAALPPAAPAQPRSKPAEPAVTASAGVIAEVNLRRRGIAFLRPAESIYGTRNVTDYYPLDEKAAITLDGKPIDLKKLRRDQVAAFEVNKVGYAVRVAVTSREELDRRAEARKQEQRKRDLTLAKLELEHARRIREESAKINARERAAARKAYEAAALAQYAAYSAAVDDWRRRQWALTPPSGLLGPGFGGSPGGFTGPGATGPAPGFTNPTPGFDIPPPAARPTYSTPDERRSAFVGKIVGAGLAHLAKVGFAQSDDFFGQLLSVGAGYIRDQVIESAIYDVAPDLPGFVRRAAARLIGQVMDGQLSFRSYAIESVKDEVIGLLKGADPAIGNLTELGTLVAEAIVGFQNARSGR